jgi:hypothetical protein
VSSPIAIAFRCLLLVLVLVLEFASIAAVAGTVFEYEYRPPGRTEYEYEEASSDMSRDREGAVVRARGVVAAVGLTRRREDAKVGVRFSVRRAADGSPRVCGVSVARAFQPEICPSAIDLRTGAVALQAVCFTRSREAAKGNAGGCCGVCVCV